MELYQRLLQLIELLADNSQTRFAKSIGLSQQTFNNYLNPEGQQKIRKTLLDTILAIYPEISRDWLFFGEGEMLGREGETPLTGPDEKDCRIAELEALRTRVAELEEELTQVNRLNRALLEKLLRLLEEDEGRAP